MRRRDFIIVIAGSAAVRPLAARAKHALIGTIILGVIIVASLVTVKRPSETMMDLEKIIADLAERKRAALVDSAEWLVANNALIALRYSADGAGDLIEDLDPDFGTTFRRPAAASPSIEQQPKALQFRTSESDLIKKLDDIKA